MILDLMLDDLPNDRPVAVLARHAERFSLESVNDALEALLTEDGQAAARSLGTKMSRFAGLTLFHSPIQRCHQTAEEIATGALGAGVAARVLGSKFELGGPYMNDWETVMRTVLTHGAGAFVRDWFSGNLPPGLAAEPKAAARQQLEILLGQLDGEMAGLTVNISHDWNVLLLRHFFLEIDDRALGWPDYLEGVAAYREGSETILALGPHRNVIRDP